MTQNNAYGKEQVVLMALKLTTPDFFTPDSHKIRPVSVVNK